MRVGLIVAGCLLVLGPVSARAEIGKASAAPGQWFLGFDAGGAASWGAERQVVTEFHQSGRSDLNFDEGTLFTGGLEVGYVLAEPNALFSRVEFNLDLSMLSRSERRDDADNAGVVIADHNSLASIQFSAQDGIIIDGDDSQTDVEARVSFKSLLDENDDHALFLSVEPYFKFQDTDGKSDFSFAPGTGLDDTAGRRDDIEAEYYGVQAALEAEHPVSDSLSLIGRASAGVYYVDSSIATQLRLSDLQFGTEITDDDSTFGGRFGAAFGVKVPLYYQGASLSLVGTIDYQTDVATIDHIQATNGQQTQADFDDRLDVGAKASLAFPLR